MIWILILNHLYLGDLILILKSSTYDDFAHLCLQCFSNSLLIQVDATFEGQTGVWRRNDKRVNKMFYLWVLKSC